MRQLHFFLLKRCAGDNNEVAKDSTNRIQLLYVEIINSKMESLSNVAQATAFLGTKDAEKNALHDEIQKLEVTALNIRE